MKYTRAKQAELTEIVRLYAKGLINYHQIPPYAYPTTTVVSPGYVEFGKTTKKDVKKKRKRKRKLTGLSPEKRIEIFGKPVRISDEALAELAEQARLAIEQASELAGELVIYCCSFLRIESRINYECTCSESYRHQIINNLR